MCVYKGIFYLKSENLGSDYTSKGYSRFVVFCVRCYHPRKKRDTCFQMSLVLHVEDFPNLSSIMREIQRLDKWNTLRNLAAKDTDSIKSNANGRRLRFNTVLQVQMIKRIKNRGRLTSLPTASAPQVVKRRDRI